MTAPVATSLASPIDHTVREVHVEQLVGRRLRDRDGNSLGRIEEIVAERRGTDLLITEVHVGPGALLERLVELSTLVPVLGALRRRLHKRYRVAWHQLDLRDPSHPRATVRHAELERVAPTE